MKSAAAFLFVVGCLWALLVAWMLFAIAGVAKPESWTTIALYWGSMSAGPLVLIVGAMMLLRGISLRLGGILVGLGCATLTVFVLYNSVVGLQPKPLSAPPPYFFYAALLTVMIFSDAAAYKVHRAISSPRPS
jgi:hypothetical protein